MARMRETMEPHEAIRVGHSGWVGYDLFCEYTDLVSNRNSRMFSIRSKRTDQTDKTKSDVKIGKSYSESLIEQEDDSCGTTSPHSVEEARYMAMPIVEDLSAINN